MIRTVLGDISSRSIGHTQCHEHLFINKGISAEINPDLLLDDFDKTCEELRGYYCNGGRYLVDAQPTGCGRNPKWLGNASAETNVGIVASTGFHKLIFYPEDHWIHTIDKFLFSELMAAEIATGMYIDCDESFPTQQIHNRAGIIKAAVDLKGLAGRYIPLFEAVVYAMKMTTATVQIHMESAESWSSIIGFFNGHQIPARKVILAHMDRDIQSREQCIKALESGVYLQFDTIGRFKYHSDTEEIDLIRDLCDAGYSEQILMGLDTTRARMKAYGGTIGLNYILDVFIPEMLRKGISQTTINKLIKTNPQSALSMG